MTCEAPSDEEIGPLITLLVEQGNELRARSQFEHVYVAAAVTSFAAASVGVGVLASSKTAYVIQPAVLGIAGIFLMTLVIGVRIALGHRNYQKVKAARAKIGRRLVASPLLKGALPEEMTKDKAGWGYLYSIAVIFVAAFIGMSICYSALR